MTNATPTLLDAQAFYEKYGGECSPETARRRSLEILNFALENNLSMGQVELLTTTDQHWNTRRNRNDRESAAHRIGYGQRDGKNEVFWIMERGGTL